MKKMKKIVSPLTWVFVFTMGLLIISCGNDKEDEPAETDMQEEVTVEEDVTPDYPAPIAGYINYVDNDSQKSMELDHDYTNKSVSELIKAIDYLSSQHNVDISMDKESMMKQVQALQKDPYSLKHADIVSDIFTKSSNALDKIQKSVKPDMNEMCDKLKKDAEAIVPQKPLLDQKAEVKEFLDQASKVIKALSV